MSVRKTRGSRGDEGRALTLVVWGLAGKSIPREGERKRGLSTPGSRTAPLIP
jgi:hypothetical protein